MWESLATSGDSQRLTYCRTRSHFLGLTLVVALDRTFWSYFVLSHLVAISGIVVRSRTWSHLREWVLVIAPHRKLNLLREARLLSMQFLELVQLDGRGRLTAICPPPSAHSSLPKPCMHEENKRRNFCPYFVIEAFSVTCLSGIVLLGVYKLFLAWKILHICVHDTFRIALANMSSSGSTVVLGILGLGVAILGIAVAFLQLQRMAKRAMHINIFELA